MKKRYEPERVKYRIDRVNLDGYTDKWFYNEQFSTLNAAEAFIENRPKSAYRGTLVVTPFTLSAGIVYETTL